MHTLPRRKDFELSFPFKHNVSFTSLCSSSPLFACLVGEVILKPLVQLAAATSPSERFQAGTRFDSLCPRVSSERLQAAFELQANLPFPFTFPRRSRRRGFKRSSNFQHYCLQNSSGGFQANFKFQTKLIFAFAVQIPFPFTSSTGLQRPLGFHPKVIFHFNFFSNRCFP